MGGPGSGRRAPGLDPAAWPKEPGGRAKGESSKAFEAFRIFRDLGATRRLSDVAAQTGKSEALYARWSARWDWRRRAAEWDELQDATARRAVLQEIEQMHKRHAQMAVSVLNKVAARLMGRDHEGNVVPTLDPSKLTARDVGNLLEIGVKLERLARGEAESRTEHVGRIDTEQTTRHTVELPDDDRTAAIIAALSESGVLPPGVADSALAPKREDPQ